MNIQKTKYQNDKNPDLVLTNFMMNRKVKFEFQNILKERNISTTSFLNQIIYKFVEENRP